MRTSADEESSYLLKWPYRPEQLKPNKEIAPVLDYPHHGPAIKLVDYHCDTIVGQRFWKITFDTERLQLEAERLQTTFRWSEKNPDSGLLSSLADEIKTYFKYTCYWSDSPYYDYAGRTLLHWQVLCGQMREGTILSEAYWKPLLLECITPQFARSIWSKQRFALYRRSTSQKVEPDFQDILHWAYQEQKLAQADLEKLPSDEKATTRLQRADDLLANIYKTVQARISNQKAMVKGILTQDRLDQEDRSLLHWAVLCRQKKAMTALCQRSPLLLKTPTRYRFYPLDMAVHLGDLEFVQLLLEQGADPNWHTLYRGGIGTRFIHEDHAKVSPLHRAVLMGRTDIVEALLNATIPADINAQLQPMPSDRFPYQYHHCTPLFYAARLHQWDMVHLLLDKGADPNLTSINKESALHYALQAVPGEIDALSHEDINRLLALIDEKNQWDRGQGNAVDPEASLKQRLLNALTECFGKTKSLAQWQPLLEGLQAFRAVRHLLRSNAHFNDLTVLTYQEAETGSTWPNLTYPIHLTSSQKAIHLCYNYDGSTLVDYPSFTAAEQQHIGTRHPRVLARHTRRFYEVLDNVTVHLRQRKTKKLIRCLHELAQNYPDTVYALIFRPLLRHHADPTQHVLKSETQIHFLRTLDSAHVTLLFNTFIRLPVAQNLLLRDGVHTGEIAELLTQADKAQVTVDLTLERTLCRKALDRAVSENPTDVPDSQRIETKIKIPLQKRLEKIQPKNPIDRQIMDLVYYFKQWRLKHASTTVRLFKRVKTNTQRNTQLALLESIRHIQDDTVKLGALIKISNDIAKEWNVFESEMKKQVDSIIQKNLHRAEKRATSFRFNGEPPAPSKKQRVLTEQKAKALRTQCLKAYEAHQQKATAMTATSFLY